MGRPDGGQGWFESALARAGIDASRLDRVESPRRPVVERSNPWQDADGIEAASRILMRARGSGDRLAQILFVTDVDDDPIARVQAAVQLARAAVARDLDVLLVDADIRHVGLTRWLQDRDLDAEGLVDVLQYGASVAAARRGSAIDGIDVLGVGSYRPDVASIFSAEDVRRLQAQLRASADLVIIVAPAYLADGRFQPLLGDADSVILSMHQDRSLADLLAQFLEHLARTEVPLGGAFLWAGPDDSERFVDDALLERSRVLPRADVASVFPGRGQVPDSTTDAHADAAAPEAADEIEERGHTAPFEPVAEPRSHKQKKDDGPSSVRIRTERPRPGARSRSRGHGSGNGLVRVAMGVLALGIVAFVAWWAVTWKSVEPTRPRIQPPARQVAQPAAPAVGPAEVAATGESLAASTDSAEVVLDGPAAMAADAGPPPVEAIEVETSRDAARLIDGPVQTAPDLVATTPATTPQPVPPADPFEAGLKRRGETGWALHISSFTTVAEAEVERASLERRGYSATVRPAIVKGRQWYRVLIGDYDSREQASGFRAQAQEKFHSDWVGVVKK